MSTSVVMGNPRPTAIFVGFGRIGSEMKCRRRDVAGFLQSVSEWSRGNLNRQAKSLMLLGPIATPKNPSNPLRLLGFFINLVAGIGFEPMTFRL
jgi:hypothetical protein